MEAETPKRTRPGAGGNEPRRKRRGGWWRTIGKRHREEPRPPAPLPGCFVGLIGDQLPAPLPRFVSPV